MFMQYGYAGELTEGYMWEFCAVIGNLSANLKIIPGSKVSLKQIFKKEISLDSQKAEDLSSTSPAQLLVVKLNPCL